MRRTSAEEMAAVLRLDGPARYRHFIKRVIDSEAAWGLRQDGWALMRDDDPARVELVGACESSFEDFGNVLATSAFNIVKDRWFCAPGVTFPDVVAMYRPKGTMRHLLFEPPFLWEDSLKMLRLESKTVAWLMAIPISEAELRFAERRGSEELEALFEREQIDAFDIDRPSAL